MFNSIINNMKEEIISSTCSLIQIPSVLSNSTPQAPFGKNCAKALEYMLNLGNKLGFRTKNIDGYCGYIEFGEGSELVGIIGHLDVVPEGENWTFPPFSATISNGKIFGRGSIDDKGPVIACLYAMKAVMDTCKVYKRVRLILGLNEENDWKCINYYKENEESPTIGFSPDADFPCIYAEKALLNTHFEQTLPISDINIVDISDNNNAINVVPKFCKVKLCVNHNTEDYIRDLQHLIQKHNYNIEINSEENKCISIISHGKSAHSAHPDLGDNAISKLLIILYEFFKLHNINIPIFSYFYKFINMQYDGKNLKINYEDESGKLTFNVAQLKLKNNVLSISSNLRIPVNTPINDIKEQIAHSLINYKEIAVHYNGEKEALYINPNSKLVTTLCNIFNETTELNATPIAIGGATYARAFNNCISFGANMPNEKDMCHQVNEFISIDNLILSCKIYAKAIYALSI